MLHTLSASGQRGAPLPFVYFSAMVHKLSHFVKGLRKK